MRTHAILALPVMPPWKWLLGSFVVAASCGKSAAKNLTKVSLADVDSLAVCGDNSPAAYFWGPAASTSSSESTLWIVDLAGGGWCYDEESCARRCPEGSTGLLCSSKTYPDSYPAPSGLFDPAADPELGAANKVFVPYCTSDAHMGDQIAFGRPFRGARVVQAVFTDLVRRHGLGSGDRKDVLIFGGQSAGARGAMVHLDYVSEMLGPEASPNVEVMGFLDSPLWIDMPPYPPSGFLGFGPECRSVFANYGVTHLGTECVEAYPSVEDTWKCIMGEYRMPHVKTPYLIVASQYDAYQLGQNKIMYVPFVSPSQEAKAYAAGLANRTAALMKSLKSSWPARSTKPNAVFSWACYDHASSLTNRGFDEQTCGSGRITLDEAVKQYFGLVSSALTAPTYEWMDSCQGFACGNGCHLISQSMFI